MKSIAALSALLAVAVALPSPDAIERSIARRRAATEARLSKARRDSVYDSNWAGAVYQGTGIMQASGSFPVLKVSIPTKKEVGEKEYTASAWVGLDGYNCDGLWQAGVDSIIEKSGSTSWYAWYEWYPAGTQVVDLGTLAAGQVITVNLTAQSATQASVHMTNHGTGKSFSKTVTSTHKICHTAAEWILEDVTFNDDSTGLANFGSVTFSQIAAVENGRTHTSVPNALIMDIQDNQNNILTSSKAVGKTVVVNYV